MKYGKNILNNIFYPRENMMYKSDKPELINHDSRFKHIYEINTKEHYRNQIKRMTSNTKLFSKSNKRKSPQICRVKNNFINIIM